MVRWLVPFTCLLALGGLAACTPPPNPTVPNIVFSGGPQFVMPAEDKVQVVEQYKPPLKAPNVEHEYGVMPAAIARAWARDRIKIDPGDGTVRMTIIDGSVVKKKLKVDKGLSGLFKDQPDRLLTARLKVRLDYVGIAGSATATVEAMAQHKFHESDTLLEREAGYYDMIEQLAAAFQKEMDASVRKHFGQLFASPT